MCRHIYVWNIVACDVKQQIRLTMLLTPWSSCALAIWSSPDPLGHQRETLSKSFPRNRLRELIVVLICRIHGLDMQFVSLVRSNCPGANKGAKSKIPPPAPPPPLPRCLRQKKLFLDKQNALKLSKRIYEEDLEFLFLVQFRSTTFDAFWHFLSL